MVRVSRRDVIGADSSPLAWAGVVVIGNGELVPLPARGRRVPVLLWVAGLLVLLGLIGSYRFIRR